MKQPIKSKDLIDEFYETLDLEQFSVSFTNKQVHDIINSSFQYTKMGFYDYRFPEIQFRELGIMFPISNCDNRLKTFLRIPEFYDLLINESVNMVNAYFKDPKHNNLSNSIAFKYFKPEYIKTIFENSKSLRDKYLKEADDFYNSYLDKQNISNTKHHD